MADESENSPSGSETWGREEWKLFYLELMRENYPEWRERRKRLPVDLVVVNADGPRQRRNGKKRWRRQ